MGTKIALGLPTNRGIKPETVRSVLSMISATEAPVHTIVSTKGFNTAENRNYLVAQAIKAGCTHLLLIDDDMIYEPNSINRLVSLQKHVVGAKYSVRRHVEGENEVIEYGNEKSDTEPFRCNALGGGLLLIDLSILPKLQSPLFWYKVFDVGMVEMSNDWWFCERVRDAGYEIWCDPTLKPGHIGEYEYKA